MATAFSGLIAAGIFAGFSDVAGLYGWQWLFINEGAGSAVAAIFAFILLPDLPESQTGSGKWLFSAEEKELARQRIALDRVSLPEADRSIWYGLGLAVKDIRTWIFVSRVPAYLSCGVLLARAAYLKAPTDLLSGCHSMGKSHCIRVQQLFPDVSLQHTCSSNRTLPAHRPRRRLTLNV